MITMKGSSGIYEGPSVSEMPNEPNIEVNTIFHELDSGKWYYYKTDGTWGEIPNTGGGGGGGFVPTETQLAAINSGITSEDVAQIGTNETNILNIKGKTDHIVTDSSSKTYYLTPTTPVSPVDGDIWIY